jgi:haloacetate dehalogenase
MSGFENFQQRQFHLPHGIRINARVANGTPSPDRPALFLLHGFPQTHVCWRRVVEQLQDAYYLVLPDLRGYGDSAQPPGAADHSNYSKRAMAADVVALAGGEGLPVCHLLWWFCVSVACCLLA